MGDKIISRKRVAFIGVSQVLQSAEVEQKANGTDYGDDHQQGDDCGDVALTVV